MTVAHTIVSRRRFERGYEIAVSTVLSGNYPSGGETVAAADIGYTAFDIIHLSPTGLFVAIATPVTPSAGGTFTSFRLRFGGDDSTSAGAGFTEVPAGAYPAFVSAGSPVYWSAICR